VSRVVWKPGRVSSSGTQEGWLATIPTALLFSVQYAGTRGKPYGDADTRPYRLYAHLPGYKTNPGADNGYFRSIEEAQQYAERMLDRWLAKATGEVPS
jgi:hypothetical protein